MRAAQTGFDFDIFEMAGFTRPSVEDMEARLRKEREAAERKAKREREQRERRERQRRERQAHDRHPGVFDPWLILGVRCGADKAEIRAAWVMLCKMHHPDGGGDIEEMKRVNRAYDSLKGGRR